jgi:aspartyl-tRNA(Asn)/glutamyl-tRNA(Gln) amidotransferase subunit C
MDSSELKTTIDMAMLELDDRQVRALEDGVNQMLEYFARMAAVDVDGVEPTTHALVTDNRTRADVVTVRTDPDEIIENAPDIEERFIAIPNVL